MSDQHVVFLERKSVKANVRRPRCAAKYTEHDKTAAHEVVARLQDATVAIINKVRAARADAGPPAQPQDDRGGRHRLRLHRRGGLHGGAASRVANIRNYAVHTRAGACLRAWCWRCAATCSPTGIDVENGEWQQSEQFCFFTHPIGDLHGSTIGIFGEGAIGQGTAALARAFGMKVLFADHEPPKAPGVAVHAVRRRSWRLPM